MSKLPIITPLLSLAGRRPFSSSSAAATAAERSQAAPASAMRKAVESAAKEGNRSTGEKFWMRDPKTGNWIPESHFGEIDVAELRAQLLAKK